MSFAKRFADQLARPHGVAGRLLGAAMDMANRKPTRLAVDLLAPQPGETILDAGCGTGAAMAMVLRRARCRVVGIDRSRTMVRQAEARLCRLHRLGSSDLHHAEIAAAPFCPGTVDGVLALNVLYFCDDEARMVAGLKSMLRPGGRLVCYVTDRATMAAWPMASTGTHRLFNAGQLAALLELGGFDPARIRIEQKAITRKVSGLFALAEA